MLSAVATAPDPRKGERLVLATQKKGATRSEFQVFAKSKGASDLMVPAEVVYLEKVPVLGTGKIDMVGVAKLVKERAASMPGAGGGGGGLVCVAAAVDIFDDRNRLAGIAVDIRRPDRHLAVAAGDIEHVGRLAEAGDAAAQLAHQRLAVGDRRAEMRRAGRQVAVVQVVGLHAVLDEGAHQRGERLASSLTPFSSTVWLTIGMPASARRASAARRRGELARMVGVERH